GQVQSATFATRELADDFLLVRALEVEAADVGARRRFVFADRDDVGPAGDFLPDILRAIERIARLVDIGQLHGRAHDDLALVRFLLSRDQLEQGRLAGAIRADDADDRARRYFETEVIDQHAIA